MPRSRADHSCRWKFVPCQDHTQGLQIQACAHQGGGVGTQIPLGKPGPNTVSAKGGEPVQDSRVKAPPEPRTAALLNDQAQPLCNIRYGAHRCPESGCGPTA
ncbi:hypothetical protein NDU88_010441 [Pleurodeles waltl]|uniref:Uncharacterized protein n=1 Tax=Pleurodeles waltl TaxID=8319 RepID=A0AAV7PXZ4_PLEWA|nr:hypothetical protein NDU88_010441 [Pleurodeles waltl]